MKTFLGVFLFFLVGLVSIYWSYVSVVDLIASLKNLGEGSFGYILSSSMGLLVSGTFSIVFIGIISALILRRMKGIIGYKNEKKHKPTISTWTSRMPTKTKICNLVQLLRERILMFPKQLYPLVIFAAGFSCFEIPTACKIQQVDDVFVLV